MKRLSDYNLGIYDSQPEIHEEEPLWKLLRKGDLCLVNNMGVVETGIVQQIIRLSNGRTLFKVVSVTGTDLCLASANEVRPASLEQCRLHLTSYELALRHFEPKGNTTATGTFYDI